MPWSFLIYRVKGEGVWSNTKQEYEYKETEQLDTHPGGKIHFPVRMRRESGTQFPTCLNPYCEKEFGEDEEYFVSLYISEVTCKKCLQMLKSQVKSELKAIEERRGQLK